MFILGIRSIFDLDFLLESDVDRLGLNYVERHRL
jgi:hypothetical protein